MGGWISREEVAASEPETPAAVKDVSPKAGSLSMRLETQLNGAPRALIARVPPHTASFQRPLGAWRANVLGSGCVPCVSMTRREGSAFFICLDEYSLGLSP